MKKFLLTITLLLTLGLSAQGAMAQGIENTGMNPSDIDGLKSAYGRSYSVDFEALMSTPSDQAGISMDAAMKSVQIQGFTFESDDKAEDFIGFSRDEVEKSFETLGMGDVEMKDLETIDKDHGYEVNITMEEQDIAMKILVFADDENVFMVTAVDTELDAATETAKNFATFVDDADSDTDDVTFNQDGTSTGGVFDYMPTADDEIVGEMSMLIDVEVYTGEAQ